MSGVLGSMRLQIMNRSNKKYLLLFAAIIFTFLYWSTCSQSEITRPIAQASTASQPTLQPSGSDTSLRSEGGGGGASTTNRNVFENKKVNGRCSQHVDQSYLSPITRLRYRKVKRNLHRLEHPYFQPDPATRYELTDGDLITPAKCSNKIRLVFLVLSMPSQRNTRDAIRQTWGSVASGKQWPRVGFEMNVKLVFVIGVPGGLGNKQTRPDDDPELKAESVIHDDILQLNTLESYSNLTRKVILGLKWIHGNCPRADYTAKVDQDIFVNVPLLWQLLMHCGHNNSIHGFIYTSESRVYRTGRWRVPRTMLSIDQYPFYASGTSYVVSNDAIAKILHTYYLFPLLRIEDAFITGVLAYKARIDHYHVGGFPFYKQARHDFCRLATNRFYTSNQFEVTDMTDMWTRLQGNGHEAC